jgi:hypothetical protein
VLNVWLMLLPVPADSPVVPDEVTVQPNVVPGILLDNGIEVVPPEHNTVAAGLAVAAGLGFTVMITGTDEPGHEFAEGTILYVIVPAEVPVAVNASVIDVPEPALPPVAPDCVGAPHVKVVPLTVLVNAIPVVVPEQIACAGGVAETFGTGLTFTVTLIGVPGHPPAEGVITYVTDPGVVPELDNG